MLFYSGKKLNNMSMKEACKTIGANLSKKIKNNKCMTSNEFFAYSLLLVCIGSILIGVIINIYYTFE